MSQSNSRALSEEDWQEKLREVLQEEWQVEWQQLESLMACDVVWYGTRGSHDVVVHLIAAPAPSVVDVNQKKRKRREKDLESPSLLELRIHSERLCKCSSYFEKAWRERRAQETPIEFSLKVRTEVLYYKDCFSRMYTPFTPIPSLKFCIELLKVATQIKFQKVVDMCVRYLTAAPWTIDEEQKIREYVRIAEFPADSATELFNRLELVVVPREERYKLLSRRVLRTMVGYLEKSVGGDKTKTTYRTRFQGVFDEIMSGSCYRLRENALVIVNQKAKRLLQCVVQHQLPNMHNREVLQAACDFQWLFKLCTTTFATQFLVEDVMENRDVSRCLKTLKIQICRDCRLYESKWTDMILSIFEGVLTGFYFLEISDRITLFEDWQWLLEDAVRKHRLGFGTRVQFIINNFITSFPHENQEAIFARWMSPGSAPEGFLEFESAHNKWIKNLVKNVSSSENQHV